MFAGNGPPFSFYLDPEASDVIKRNFRLEVDYKGDGKATLYSKTTFDRETQSVYSVPVVVRDSGYPSLSSTCAVTVTIGDVNDNDMKDGWKNVTVYYISDEAHLLGNNKRFDLIYVKFFLFFSPPTHTHCPLLLTLRNSFPHKSTHHATTTIILSSLDIDLIDIGNGNCDLFVQAFIFISGLNRNFISDILIRK